MWGLEYALLFGVPNNKLELIEGRPRLAFPFLSREQAEAHFETWLDTLCHWKGVAARPPVEPGRLGPKVEAQGFVMELAPRPVEMRVPLDGEVFLEFYRTSWRRDYWGGQPPGLEAGWDHFLNHQDVQMRLWSLFGGWCSKHGGQHAGRVGLVLSDTAAVEPDQYYYRNVTKANMIADDYFRGPPDLIAEVLSPASRAIDRGPRKELYRRSGVSHLWLLDPTLETVEVYELAGGDYRLTGTYRAGEVFRPALFPSEPVAVDGLFDTQLKRHGGDVAPEEPAPIPEWLVSPRLELGLEYLFLLGHPERRWEIWGNRAPCVLAFGSEREAASRWPHFLEEAARWEDAPVPKPAPLGADAEQAEVGRFRLTRRGRQVWLDVAVDARKYAQVLEVCADRDAWDWGEN